MGGNNALTKMYNSLMITNMLVCIINNLRDVSGIGEPYIYHI